MARSTLRGRKIRTFILNNVQEHGADIANLAAAKFGITRQAINYHLQRLEDEGKIEAKGATRSRSYTLAESDLLDEQLPLTSDTDEDDVWRAIVRPHLAHLRKNVLDIWHYGFTEMLNNAIDHSEGTLVEIRLRANSLGHHLVLRDNGVGVFRKIKEAFQLSDEQHAILELAKGKLTTDPDNHTGEGIFFCSRVFDLYSLQSGQTLFVHKHGENTEYISADSPDRVNGTMVTMELRNNVHRTLDDVMSKFAAGDDYLFTKTLIPVRLAQYGDELLVSRSQAKRLLARLDRFDVVVLDFSGIQAIGQAFADELFRVFPKRHPEIELIPTAMKEPVGRLIRRAQAALRETDSR